MSKTFVTRAQVSYDAPRELVWALVSDTNRSDRGMGLAPARYRWERDEQGRNVRIAAAKELGVAIEWVEPPYRWMEGRFIEGRRDFVKGPAEAAGMRITLEDRPNGGTELRAETFFRAGGLIAWLLGPIQILKIRHNLRRYFAHIATALAPAGELSGSDAEPAVVRAQKLLTSGYDSVTSGPRTPPNDPILRVREARLREQPLSKEAVDKLLEHLRERPDEEVQQMRPFELARLWGLDRREVLRVFLHATVLGLTDLRWQVNCPICRVGAAIASDLSEVTEKGHCEACQIEYDTDFAKHVEAVFPCNQGVRSVSPALYCASSPAFLPHVYAQLHVPPGGTSEHDAELPRGALHLRALGLTGTSDLQLSERPASLRVRVTEAGVEAEAEGAAEGVTHVTLTSELDHDCHVLIERAGWSADAVLGSVIASFPEFMGLFATEAPAAGVDLRVGSLALLFSDLVGSTALYEHVGDARAFAIVQEHFRAMRAAIEKNDGAIVKTMGDAVMASFPSLRHAVAGALAMIEAHDAAHAGDGLGVKIGVHAGPCLAVRANERLDFFGTTVNMAARLQAKAEASELVLTVEAASDPTVAPLVGARARREFDASLKGIRDAQRLVGIDCRSAPGG